VNVVLCIWVLSLTYSSTAYVASIPAIMQEYHIGREGKLARFRLRRRICSIEILVPVE